MRSFWVCKSLVDYDFDEIVNIVKMKSVGSYKGSKIDLDYFIDWSPNLVMTSNCRYLEGVLYFEVELPINKMEIEDDGEFKLVRDVTKTAHSVDFVFFDNGIFLFKRMVPHSITKAAQRLFSTILFKRDDAIRTLSYNIDRIREDVWADNRYLRLQEYTNSIRILKVLNDGLIYFTIRNNGRFENIVREGYNGHIWKFSELDKIEICELLEDFLEYALIGNN